MASGLPIISTRSVGVVDCVRHEDNGLLHDPGDVVGLRALLVRILADGDLRQRLRDVALQEVRARYSWPVLAGAVVASYAQLEGTEPDDDWSLPGAVDPACRFRAAAHLL